MYLPTNKYHIWYNNLINSARQHNHSHTEYKETHHIIPKSFYKSVSPTGWLDGNPHEQHNLVELTPREHYIAHKLLIKMTYGLAKNKMISAVWHLVNVLRKQNVFFTARNYDHIRKLAIENMSQQFEQKWQDKEWASTQMARLQAPDRREHLKQKMKDVRGQPDIRKKQSEISKARWSDPEYKETVSKKMTEINRSPEKREAQSVANKLLWTPERKAAWSEQMKLIRSRPELRERQSQITKERNAIRGPISQETRAKMAASLRGKKRGPCSESTKEKIRQAAKSRVRSAEHKQNLSAARKGKVWWTNGIETKVSTESPGQGLVDKWHRN